MSRRSPNTLSSTARVVPGNSAGDGLLNPIRLTHTTTVETHSTEEAAHLRVWNCRQTRKARLKYLWAHSVMVSGALCILYDGVSADIRRNVIASHVYELSSMP